MKSGQTLGNRYDLHQLIGEGSAAQVFLGFDRIMQRDVAVKAFLPAIMGDSKESASQFGIELRAMARLEHPHILPIYDAGSHADTYFLVMRYADRGSLHDEIKQGIPTMERTFASIYQIGRALAYAHHHKMIHRDVNPRNILVEESGDCYLSDFSLAVTHGAKASYRPGQSAGAASYQSPEAIAGGELTAKSDVYSLTATLFELLTGKPPFEGMPKEQIAAAIEAEGPPDPLALRPDLPITLIGVLAAGMAKKPDDRYETPLELVSACKTALAGQL